MDPIMVQAGPIAVRWYGFLIAAGVLLGGGWALRWARARGLDEEVLLDAAPWLVAAGIAGARLVFVVTSPSAYFGPDGDPLSALAIWQGGISIHGGVLGIVIAMSVYARIRRVDTWAYLDVMTPVAALGIIGGRLGNFMNGSDTTGRLTGWGVGFTWPDPGTETLGAFGRAVLGEALWSGYPGTCDLGSQVPLLRCLEQGGTIVRGPVHPTQMYGALVGLLLIPILVWAFRRSRRSGFVFWQFVLWYSLLRSLIEEPFRDNPLYWNVYLSEGPGLAGVGLLTLTQLVSLPLILIAGYLLFVGGADASPLDAKRQSRAAGREPRRPGDRRSPSGPGGGRRRGGRR